MEPWCKPARVNLRILTLLLAAVSVLGIGAYLLHGYRVRSAVRHALQAGNTAYEARQFTVAATELGRYLSRNPEDSRVLLRYADAQLRRRPRVKGAVEQAINAFEQILRQQPASGRGGEAHGALSAGR